VTAYNADGVPATTSLSVFSRDFGSFVGELADPAGDDKGPGTYTYPTNGVYRPGIFDLRAVEVYTEGDQVRFVTRIEGPITNDFGGDQISHQRINVYLGSGDGSVVPAMPGTNMDVASPWSRAVVIDGRFGLAGVYAPNGAKVSGGTLSTLAQTKEIVLTVPRSALADIDLSTARTTGTTRPGTSGGSRSTASAAARACGPTRPTTTATRATRTRST
jgi:carbohydrate-binding DOMON domain-containing protein